MLVGKFENHIKEGESPSVGYTIKAQFSAYYPFAYSVCWISHKILMKAKGKKQNTSIFLLKVHFHF